MQLLYKYLLLGCLFALASCTSSSSSITQLTQVPNLELHGLDGRTELSASLLHGKVTVLNVWATWCPPCRYEMPSLEALSKSLDKERFQVIGITVDADKFLAKEFLAQTGVTFRNFIDDNQLADALHIQVYPTTLIILPNGQISEYVLGDRAWNGDEMRQKILQLANEASGLENK